MPPLTRVNFTETPQNTEPPLGTSAESERVVAALARGSTNSGVAGANSGKASVLGAEGGHVDRRCRGRLDSMKVLQALQSEQQGAQRSSMRSHDIRRLWRFSKQSITFPNLVCAGESTKHIGQRDIPH